jgi:voltage-dependent potassium channel beta subunit
LLEFNLKMIYKNLGNSGLKVSALALGSGMSTVGEKVDSKTFEGIMELAFEKGVNLLDTAENYGMGKAPQIIGEILKRLNWDRSSYVLLSKVFYGGRRPNQVGLSLKHIRDSCDRALRDLKVDYLDIFLCHSFDANTPLEETVFAMNNLLQTGKILYWGTSNWEADQIAAAIKISKSNGLREPVVHQPCYNLMARKTVEGPLKAIATEYGIGLTTYSPLNCGYLSGKYNRNVPVADSRFELPRFQDAKAELLSSERSQKYSRLVALLNKVADELECTIAQAAIAWCLKNPQVTSVILGVTSNSQIVENLEALAIAEKLSAEVMVALDQVAIEMPM